MTDLHLDEFIELGSDEGRGNVLGVQPYMLTQDYATRDSFYAKLEGYLQAANARGWITPHTVAVFPEYIGTWLATTGEKAGIYRMKSLSLAMRALALAHPLALARSLLASTEPDKIAAALFRMQAGQMARVYRSVFSDLARRYRMTLVAGSIVLPEPSVQKGRIAPGSGALYNVSAVFRPDGASHSALVRKLYPISDEQPFVTPGRIADLPAFETPAGRMGVLICANSWYPAAYARLNASEVDFVAVPSFYTGRSSWQQPWRGYDGGPLPADVDPGDIGRLTEAQAWREHALAGRIEESGARSGLNVFLQGQLWDMDAGGRSLMVRDGQVMEAESERGALLNLWLPQRNVPKMVGGEK